MLTVITDAATLTAAQQTFRENLLATMPQRITCTASHHRLAPKEIILYDLNKNIDTYEKNFFKKLR